MNATPENSPQADKSIYEVFAAQFNWAPLAVLSQYLRSLDTQEYKPMLTALMEKASQNDKINKQIQAWEQERVDRTALVSSLS